jgi:hypothetical protein
MACIQSSLVDFLLSASVTLAALAWQPWLAIRHMTLRLDVQSSHFSSW